MMKRNDYWDKFMASGKVSDYLKFRAIESGEEDSQERLKQIDRAFSSDYGSQPQESAEGIYKERSGGDFKERSS